MARTESARSESLALVLENDGAFRYFVHLRLEIFRSLPEEGNERWGLKIRARGTCLPPFRLRQGVLSSFSIVVRPTRRPEARLDKDVREIGREEKVLRDPMRSAVVESVGRELAGWRHRIVL